MTAYTEKHLKGKYLNYRSCGPITDVRWVAGPVIYKIKCCNYKIIKQETMVCVPFSRFILHLLVFTHCDCDSLSTQSMPKGPGQTSACETVEVTPGLCKLVKQNGSIFFLSI